MALVFKVLFCPQMFIKKESRCLDEPDAFILKRVIKSWKIFTEERVRINKVVKEVKQRRAEKLQKELLNIWRTELYLS